MGAEEQQGADLKVVRIHKPAKLDTWVKRGGRNVYVVREFLRGNCTGCCMTNGIFGCNDGSKFMGCMDGVIFVDSPEAGEVARIAYELTK